MDACLSPPSYEVGSADATAPHLPRGMGGQLLGENESRIGAACSPFRSRPLLSLAFGIKPEASDFCSVLVTRCSKLYPNYELSSRKFYRYYNGSQELRQIGWFTSEICLQDTYPTEQPVLSQSVSRVRFWRKGWGYRLPCRKELALESNKRQEESDPQKPLQDDSNKNAPVELMTGLNVIKDHWSILLVLTCAGCARVVNLYRASSGIPVSSFKELLQPAYCRRGTVNIVARTQWKLMIWQLNVHGDLTSAYQIMCENSSKNHVHRFQLPLNLNEEPIQ